MSPCDVVIVGGAAHGASVAYHLAADPSFAGRIVLIEKDPTFARAATALSAGGIRQQFSTPVNVSLSLYGIDFLRRAGDLLAVDGDRPDVGLVEGGYLFLASAAGAEVLAGNHALQTGLGADIVRLDAAGLAARFPWLSTEGIVAGCFGQTGEGWFDGYAFARALRRKAQALGVELVSAEVAAIEAEAGRATAVRLADGSRIAAGAVVVAAGPATPRLLARLGVLLPVEARKRYVFSFACREPLPRIPLTVDPSGVYVRSVGEIYICGASPPEGSEPPASDFEVDHGFFEEAIWPVLARRIPAFAAIRPGRAWAGYYDFNILDQNAIVGPVGGHPNLLVATGFSGHGLQQAPGVGRGLAELLVHGRYASLDLSPLGYERIAARQPLVEINVV
ncbi:MAG TPA: FAD-binding oxidoreductase [Bauldia sp.]|nr:FAD-binding oxidoreductase [Bauldia sp.]